MARFSLSAVKFFMAASHQSEPIWIGVDVHKRSYHVALLRSDSKTYTFVAPACPETFVKLCRRLDLLISGVVYEAGPTGFSLARVLQAERIPVIVAAPSKVPRSVSAGAKTDRLDCLKLAQFGAKGLIRPIAIPTAQEEAHRSLVRRRHQLVDGIRRSKQRIKGFLLYHGFQETNALKNWHSDYPEQIAALPLEEEGRLTIESHLRELNFLQNELSSVTQQLDQINLEPHHRTVIRALSSVPGVGKVVATTFHTEMFRPERFNSGEEVASYLGLAPSVRQSGESPRSSPVSIVVDRKVPWTRIRPVDKKKERP